MHIPALGQTVASLGAAVKNQHSHRALAAAQLIEQLREVWRLG
jgi:XTP/dITP diphosphohydrolase